MAKKVCNVNKIEFIKLEGWNNIRAQWCVHRNCGLVVQKKLANCLFFSGSQV